MRSGIHNPHGATVSLHENNKAISKFISWRQMLARFTLWLHLPYEIPCVFISCDASNQALAAQFVKKRSKMPWFDKFH